jgi:hypothetical protein
MCLDNPLLADDRNFYKVEKWTKDGMKVDRLFYADNNLQKARDVFANAIKHRPRIRLTIRQRTRVLQQWPRRNLNVALSWNAMKSRALPSRGRFALCTLFAPARGDIL